MNLRLALCTLYKLYTLVDQGSGIFGFEGAKSSETNSNTVSSCQVATVQVEDVKLSQAEKMPQDMEIMGGPCHQYGGGGAP